MIFDDFASIEKNKSKSAKNKSGRRREFSHDRQGIFASITPWNRKCGN